MKKKLMASILGSILLVSWQQDVETQMSRPMRRQRRRPARRLMRRQRAGRQIRTARR